MPPPRSICLSTCPARPLAISNGGSSPYSPPPPPPPPHPPPPPPPPPFTSLKQIFHSTCSSSDPPPRPYTSLKQIFNFTCSPFTFQKFFSGLISIVYMCVHMYRKVDTCVHMYRKETLPLMPLMLTVIATTFLLARLSISLGIRRGFTSDPLCRWGLDQALIQGLPLQIFIS